MGQPRPGSCCRAVRHAFFIALLAAVLSWSGVAAAETIAPVAEAPQNAPHRTYRISASKYHFTPDHIEIRRGFIGILVVNSEDVTHGMHVIGTGESKDVVPGVPTVVQFYAKEPGRGRFACSHHGGLGHLFMSGTITVE